DESEVGNIQDAIAAQQRVQVDEVRIAFPESVESKREIADLREKNSALEQRVEEQERRIIDLEKKYRVLLMIVSALEWNFLFLELLVKGREVLV
ncbi:hypothetical protein PRIPAC_93186, partial [Pristionchus pacificus]|uniref:Uncharacterized protein n=1 Tax=Pristionchus pacificus TaxID=54126 RepID=A0A2A6BAE3_PRIPA